MKNYLDIECRKLKMDANAVKAAMNNRVAIELKRRAAVAMAADGYSVKDITKYLGFKQTNSITDLLRSGPGPVAPETVLKMFEYRNKRLSHREIGEKLGIPSKNFYYWEVQYTGLMKLGFVKSRKKEPLELAEEILKEECAKIGMDHMWAFTTEKLAPAVEMRRRVANRLFERGWSGRRIGIALGYSETVRLPELMPGNNPRREGLTPEAVAEFHRLRAKGVSVKKASIKMGITYDRGNRWDEIYKPAFKDIAV